MNERIKKLRQESMNTRPSLTMARAKLVTEAYETYAGNVSTPVLRALSFQNILEHMPLYIGEGELIVGEKGGKPQTSPTYPELCCHTMEDLDVISQRDTIFFDVSTDDRAIHEGIIPKWQGKSLREHIVESMSEEWNRCYLAGIFTEFMEQRAPGHTVGDDKYYKKGFVDFKQDVKKAMERCQDDGANSDKLEQLKAMAIACDAIVAFGTRYAEYARELADGESDKKRRQELLTIAENCECVPMHRPQSFHQAVQMYWFVHLGVTLELNTWDSFSPGRLDQYLYPFYVEDMRKGILDEERAKEILSCLWIKFNNQPAPPKVGITLKESGTYTDFANINSGGINPYTGEDGVNDVSYMILDVMRDLKLTQPSSNVQISEKTPKAFLQKACEVVRDGWGQPAIYNTEIIIEELMSAGKTLVDARFGGASGCVETGASGREAYILTGYLNVPKIFEITLNNGYDPISDQQLGPQTGDPRDFTTYKELYHAFKAQLRYFIEVKMEGNDTIERLVGQLVPAPFMSILTDDCIQRGEDYNRGGARYNTRYIQCVGIGTITDALSAVKYGVYESETFTMDEVLHALRDDFVGHDRIKHWVDHAPKYGNDDDRADTIMDSVFHTLYHLITGPTVYGGHYRIDMLPTTCHVYFG